MPSGQKALVINGLERAVSTDVNRLQSFAGAGLAEVLRALQNTSQGVDGLFAADAQPALGGSPLSGEVHSGYVVRLVPGTLNLTVDSGVAYVLPATDSDPDSSAYKQVRDPGVNSGSPLVITPNTSGAIRIDVVECSYSLNARNAGTDNRDAYSSAPRRARSSPPPSARPRRAASRTKCVQAWAARVSPGRSRGGCPSARGGGALGRDDGRELHILGRPAPGERPDPRAGQRGELAPARERPQQHVEVDVVTSAGKALLAEAAGGGQRHRRGGRARGHGAALALPAGRPVQPGQQRDRPERRRQPERHHRRGASGTCTCSSRLACRAGSSTA